MRFGVLGPLEVWTDDGQAVAIPGTKVRALLADLLSRPGQLLSADRLIEDLWGENLPGNPIGTLQGKVSQLRRALDDAESGGRDLVRYQPPGYMLDFDAEDSDSGQFEALLGRALPLVAGDPSRALKLLSQALALWRGPALAEFIDEPFARPVITHLEEKRLIAIEAHIEARLALGQYEVLVAELDALVADYPLRERLRGLHMRALYGAGRQAEALESYQELRSVLLEELGLDPSPDLDDLQQAILQQDSSLEVPMVARCRRHTNLPAPQSRFVGSLDRVGHIRDLLATNRLVTLVGPGGVGKTRLALEAARGLIDAYPGGVWLVELATSHDSLAGDGTESLAEEVAATLDVQLDVFNAGSMGGTREIMDQLAGAIDYRPLLLVLDSCEHVIGPVAELTDRLLGAAGTLNILATSRVPLGLTGEQIWPIEPLTLPPEDGATDIDPERLLSFESVAFFADRASAVDPGFEVSGDNVDDVVAICRRLDGLPLALELAAARLRLLSVSELATNLDDLFRLLTTGNRNAPKRQQTLWALITRSWELLTSAEREVLSRLSAFSGPAALPAIEAVCSTGDMDTSEVLDIIGRLVDHSLVVVQWPRGHARYGMLETVRAYGLERLEEAGEEGVVRRRHAAYYVELAEEADRMLRGNSQDWWLERLDAEIAELRAAAHWAIDADTELALRLLNAYAWYGYLRGRQGQLCRYMIRALPGSESVSLAAQARAHAWLGSLGSLDGSVADPSEHRHISLDLHARLGEPSAFAHAQLLLGGLLLPRGEIPDADRLISESLETFRSTDDDWGIAGALCVRGWLELGRGDPDAARLDGEEAQRLYSQVGDRWGMVRAAELLGQIAETQGDYDAATDLHSRALKTAQGLGMWASVALETARLGRVAILNGDDTTAVELHERALAISSDLGFEQGIAFARVGLGLIARRQGRLDDAEENIAAVLGWHQERGFHAGVAFCLAELGFVAELRGDSERATTLHRKGLEAALSSDDARAIALALEGVAGASAISGSWEKAAILLGAATAMRLEGGGDLPQTERVDVERIAAIAADALGSETFNNTFEKGQGMDLAAVLGCIRSIGPDQ